jgi:site-specific DNA-methyltransferase (adenine-specific)
MIELLHIDCMEYMATLPDKAFDFCITDPPYGVGLKYNTYDDTLDNWHDLMNRFIPEIKRVCEMVIFPSCSINKMQWIYKNYPPDWLISWHKGSTGHAAYIGFNDWEPLLVYGKIKGLYLHDYFSAGNNESMGNYGHPCPKPLKYYTHFYSRIPTGKKVFEPFLGSGTGAIAAHKWGFDFVGTELDLDYYNAAVKRFKEQTMQQTLFKP